MSRQVADEFVSSKLGRVALGRRWLALSSTCKEVNLQKRRWNVYVQVRWMWDETIWNMICWEFCPRCSLVFLISSRTCLEFTISWTSFRCPANLPSSNLRAVESFKVDSKCMKNQIQFHCTFVLHDFEMFWGRLITPKDCWILDQHSERKVSQTFRKPAGHRVPPSTYPPNIECKRYSSCLEVGVPFLSRFPKPSQIPGQICSFEWSQFAKTC